MTPMAGGVANTEQDRQIALLGRGECLLAPLEPVDRVVLVLEEIGARGGRETVRHAPDLARTRLNQPSTGYAGTFSPVRRLVELSRFVVALPALGSIFGAVILMVIGTLEIARSAIDLFDSSTPLKVTVVGILTAVDTLLLATVLLVIGYGLYELFVDSKVTLPPWLEIRSLDDLKSKLIGVVVAIIAVVFLGILVDAKDADAVLRIGVGAGVVIAGLAAFTYTSKK